MEGTKLQLILFVSILPFMALSLIIMGLWCINHHPSTWKWDPFRWVFEPGYRERLKVENQQ